MPETEDKEGLIVDALTEAGNIGAGHAATSLSKLMRENVINRSTKSLIIPLDEVPQALGGAERIMAAVYTTFSGELSGGILMLFPEQSAKTLARILANCEIEGCDLNEYQSSILSEVGNICVCWYMSAVSKIIEFDLIPSRPILAYDMLGAVIDLPLIDIGRMADTVLLIITDFKGEINEIEGIFLMMLEPDSKKKMAEKLGV